MPFGIQNITPVNITDIINMTNVTGMDELIINANTQIYGGLYFFIMLWVTLIILYFSMSKVPILDDKPLVKGLMAFAAVTLIALPMRLLCVTGVCLINDPQLWAFIIPTILIATVLWATQR